MKRLQKLYYEQLKQLGEKPKFDITKFLEPSLLHVVGIYGRSYTPTLDKLLEILRDKKKRKMKSIDVGSSTKTKKTKVVNPSVEFVDLDPDTPDQEGCLVREYVEPMSVAPPMYNVGPSPTLVLSIASISSIKEFGQGIVEVQARTKLRKQKEEDAIQFKELEAIEKSLEQLATAQEAKVKKAIDEYKNPFEFHKIVLYESEALYVRGFTECRDKMAVIDAGFSLEKLKYHGERNENPEDFSGSKKPQNGENPQVVAEMKLVRPLRRL
ncbi:hypothetical protein O6P43_002540 [Quillaja saponaria]|uniref:Uncharacterized protein n=1 Tax=Quillaja saponaria TaxID=32244 RepID=A0AAD7VKL6_QUISA|nr:hypothetical protein O6P43_002540 [Quillaja saponaria]